MPSVSTITQKRRSLPEIIHSAKRPRSDELYTLQKKPVKIEVKVEKHKERSQKVQNSTYKSPFRLKSSSAVTKSRSNPRRSYIPQGITSPLDAARKSSTQTPPVALVNQCAILAEREKFVSMVARLGGPPVRIINDVDDEPCPQNVTIVNSYILDETIPEQDEGFIFGCEHSGACTDIHYGNDKEQDNCNCQSSYYEHEEGSEELPYDFEGRLTQTFTDGIYHHKAVFECGPQCKCSEDCPLRVVSKGRQLPLNIFKTKYCGWGIRCPLPIKQGTFIDIYYGDLIWRGSRSDEDTSYIFDLDHFGGTDAQPSELELYECDYQPTTEDGVPLLSVDGLHRGSLMRFVNNSCDPNCRVVSVLPNTSADQTSRYHLAFFASRDIGANEELTVKYSPAAARLRRKGDTCFCGSYLCNGHLWP